MVHQMTQHIMYQMMHHMVHHVRFFSHDIFFQMILFSDDA